MRTATAWKMIGWDDGDFRIKGGRANYEAVMYNCVNNATNVKLARLECYEQNGIKEVSRYVAPDTILEFYDEKAFDSFCEEMHFTILQTNEKE